MKSAAVRRAALSEHVLCSVGFVAASQQAKTIRPAEAEWMVAFVLQMHYLLLI